MDMAGVPTLRKARSLLNRYLSDATKVFRHGFGHGSDPKMITVSVDRRERREQWQATNHLIGLGLSMYGVADYDLVFLPDSCS